MARRTKFVGWQSTASATRQWQTARHGHPLHHQHLDRDQRPAESRRLFVNALGLPLTGDDDYLFSESLNGIKHFGIWPLAAAAYACFGINTWPADRPIPQASIEFEVDDVAAAAQELQDEGYQLLHPARIEPWNQTVARL